MNKKLKRFLPRVLTVAVLLVFIGYLWRNLDRYHMLLDFPFRTLVLLATLELAFAVVNGSINYILYRALGAALGFQESVGLAAVNSLFNQLPFSAGLVGKGVYLKRRYQLAYAHFLGATTALYVSFVAVNGVIGLVVPVGVALRDGTRVPFPLVLAFCAMTATAVLLWVPVDALSLPGSVGQQLRQLAEGWRTLTQRVTLVGVMTSLQLVGTLLFALRLWIAFHALSQEVTYAQCLLFSAATVLTRLVSIMPGGLGVREGIVAGVAAILGFDAGVSVVAVGLDRLVATSVIIVVGTTYSYILGKKVLPVDPESEDCGCA